MTDDYVTINQAIWDADAPHWVAVGERLWQSDTPVWGNWNTPGTSVDMLPDDMAGLDAIELGCGTAYVSGWMARRGAKVTAIDISPVQMETAQRLARATGWDITFITGNAEKTGLADANFDFAISEYGAAIWCEPAAWLTEAWRLLRPGGRLVFLGNHPLSLICSPLDGAPCDRRLHRSYRGMWGADWRKVAFEPSGVCFNLTFADWMDLFARIGFVVTRYQEIYVPDDADGVRAAIPADWGKEYPVEQVWHLVKSG